MTKMKDKGNQRASVISLVPSEYLKSQIDALNAPLDDLACEDYAREDDSSAIPVDQKVLDKAVKAINKQLVTARSKKLPDTALDAIAEQLQYLRAQQQGDANENGQTGLDDHEDGIIGVDREYWLESLPTTWPEQANEADTEADDKELREQYTQLVASTRALKTKHRLLEQRTAHYERVLAILDDELDVEQLQTLLSKPQSKKRQKQVEDSEDEE